MNSTAIDIMSISDEPVEQEVFETPGSNIPEFRPYRVIEDRENENIDRSSISIAKVAAHFKQKAGEEAQQSKLYLQGHRKLLYRSYVTNALSSQKDYEKLFITKESAAQKLRRIMLEIQELETEIEQTKENPDDFGEEITPSDIISQLNSIQQKASQLSLKLPGNQPVAVSAVGSHMLKKLNGLFLSRDLPSIPASLKPPPYSEQVSHALELEARVASLETLLGPETLVKANIPQAQGLSSLLQSMSQMLEKIRRPDHVFTINKRLKELISELDRLVTLRDGLKQLGRDQVIFSESSEIDSETKTKIDSMLMLLDQFDLYVALGPQFVTRLKQLTNMHQELGGFDTTLDRLEVKINNVHSDTKSGEECYHELLSEMQETQDKINSNLKALDSRMGDLFNRLKSLG